MALVGLVLDRLSFCNETIRKAPKHEFWVYGMHLVLSLRKIFTQLRLANFCVNGASSASFASSFVQ
jgi:hypothetical protein